MKPWSDDQLLRQGVSGTRRGMLELGARSGLLALLGAASPVVVSTTMPGRYDDALGLLDQYAELYRRDLLAPGLVMVLTDATGVQRLRAYGFDDPAAQTPLNADRLIHIGSISKSFVAICLLQLREEGRLDLRRPITDYLPWLRYDGATRLIGAHDLLTHSAALPDGPLFPADPTLRYLGTAAPGSIFHYCNMGYVALGHLVAKLDARPLSASLRARILEPLGMTQTDPAITLDTFEKVAGSFQPAYSDRPFPRDGRLVCSPPIVMTDGSGCIASTARDMGQYLMMLVNRGAYAGGRLLSEEGFTLLTHPHVAAREFGPDAFYGYGVVVDQIEGHTRIRHTGGMVSFASSLEVDLEAGVGAFASINAMQTFRPRPITTYALRLMRVAKEGAQLPALPPANLSWRVEAATDYVGPFMSTDGKAIELVAEGERLFLIRDGHRAVLEPMFEVEDAFVVADPLYEQSPLAFTRAGPDGKGPVVEAGWGEEWYFNQRYQGPRSFDVPAAWRLYRGHYRSEDPWIGSVRIVLRRGKLWVNGAVPLEDGGNGRFYFRDEPQSPEWIAFSDFVYGVPMTLSQSGWVLHRV